MKCVAIGHYDGSGVSVANLFIVHVNICGISCSERALSCATMIHYNLDVEVEQKSQRKTDIARRNRFEIPCGFGFLEIGPQMTCNIQILDTASFH
jgi:hypothetical protein